MDPPCQVFPASSPGNVGDNDARDAVPGSPARLIVHIAVNGARHAAHGLAGEVSRARSAGQAALPSRG